MFKKYRRRAFNEDWIMAVVMFVLGMAAACGFWLLLGHSVLDVWR